MKKRSRLTKQTLVLLEDKINGKPLALDFQGKERKREKNQISSQKEKERLQCNTQCKNTKSYADYSGTTMTIKWITQNKWNVLKSSIFNGLYGKENRKYEQPNFTQTLKLKMRLKKKSPIKRKNPETYDYGNFYRYLKEELMPIQLLLSQGA